MGMLGMRRRGMGRKMPFDTNGYDFVDMGEAGIWATCNIGANSPEESGLFFQWGDTIGYKDAYSKPGGFSWSSYKFKGSESGGQIKYNNEDGLKTLEPEDDAAHIIMGGDWRMPTADEFRNLLYLCDNEFINNYKETGISGLLLTLRKNKERQIFFPATGAWIGNSNDYIGVNSFINSSSLVSNLSQAALHFTFQGHCTVQTSNRRYYGFVVRAFIPKYKNITNYETLH